jgi:hypothetical protein
MEEIKHENLIQGIEYFLECFTNDAYNNKIPLNPRYKMVGTFDRLEYNIFNFVNIYFKNFKQIKYKNSKKNGYDVFLNHFWKFYEVSKEKIQKKMESRALHTILHNILNDEYFRTELIYIDEYKI